MAMIPDRVENCRQRYQPDKRAVMVFFALLFVIGAFYVRQREFLSPDVVSRYERAHPVLAITSFLLIYGITTVVALPTLPLNLAAGLLWGSWWGGLLSAAGSTIGATGAFFTARLFLGQPLARKYENWLLAWTRPEHAEKDWRWIAFLRLNPIFPTGVLNYLIGLTAIRPRTYVWATFCFLLPPSFAIALIGRQLETFAVTGDVTRWVRSLLLFSAAAVTLVGLRYGGRYLNRIRHHPS